MSAYVPARLRRRVLAEANGLCAYCRSSERLMGVLFEIDHILPISAGGATTLENLCLACPVCNRFKAIRIAGLDPVTLQEARLFHPRIDRWSEHFSWLDHGSALHGLTPIGRVTIEALRMNRPEIIELRRYWVALGLHPPGQTD